MIDGIARGYGEGGGVRTRFATIRSSRIVVRAIPKDTIGNPVEPEDKRRRLWTTYTPFVIAYNRNDERTEVNLSDRKLTSNCVKC